MLKDGCTGSLYDDSSKFSINRKKLGNLNLAADILGQELNLNPSNSWARLELVRVLMLLKQFDTCQEIISEGLRIGKDVFNVLAAKAELYEFHGNRDDALLSLEEGARLYPSNVNAAYHLLGYLKRVGDYNRISEFTAEFIKTCNKPNADKLMFSVLPYINISKQKNSDFNVAWHPRVPRKIIKNAAIVMLIRNESDIIYFNLRHHYMGGIRYFFIMNNASNDETQDAIDKASTEFSDALFVTIRDPIMKHLQGSKTTLLAKYAYEYCKMLNVELKWVFPLDADEFINAPLDLGDLLDRLPDHVRLGALTMRNLAPSAVHQELPADIDFYDEFSTLKNSMLIDNPMVKTAFVYQDGIQVAEGNHYVNNRVNEISEVCFFSDYGIYLNHLPIRSISQITKKTINGATAMQGLQGGGHWKDRYNHYLRYGDASFIKIVENYLND